MKIQRTLSLFTILFLALLLLGCSKDDDTIHTTLDIDLSILNDNDWEKAEEILTLINDYRKSIDLPIIKMDRQYASAIALDHTQYMIDVGTISHDFFMNRSNALKEIGIKRVGENVAFGYTSTEALVNAWIESPGHRQVIEGNFTHSGFGVLKNEKGVYYYTQLFCRK